LANAFYLRKWWVQQTSNKCLITYSFVLHNNKICIFYRILALVAFCVLVKCYRHYTVSISYNRLAKWVH
jgi:hypothetical protein